MNAWSIADNQFKIENTNHPENASILKGQEATFKCEFSYTKNVQTLGLGHYYARLEFSKPVQNMNETTFETCTMQYIFEGERNMTVGKCAALKSARFEKRSIDYLVAEVTTLTLRIPKVSASLSGSRATCSLYSNSILQCIAFTDTKWFPSCWLWLCSWTTCFNTHCDHCYGVYSNRNSCHPTEETCKTCAYTKLRWR